MREIGFSSGALARSRLADAVHSARRLRVGCIELSALRVAELATLEEFVGSVELSAFSYVSLNAPTDYTADQEAWVASVLCRLGLQHRWPVVVHPDCVIEPARWHPLGSLLCIENMDKRKPIGRTLDELLPVFAIFPEAQLCFDVAHAHQIDTSMTEAYRILKAFGTRIGQVHLSEVTSSSRHTRLSDSAVDLFKFVSSQLRLNVPVILESPVDSLDEAQDELRQASRIFANNSATAASA